MINPLLNHAAQLLEEEAQSVRECHNVNQVLPDWAGEPEAKAHYDNLMQSARSLRALATQPTWTPVATLPDADTTVMLFTPGAGEEVWPGYFDGDIWRTADGMPANPTMWQIMPIGPA